MTFYKVVNTAGIYVYLLQLGVEEMARQLRAPTTLLEGPGSISYRHACRQNSNKH